MLLRILSGTALRATAVCTVALSCGVQPAVAQLRIVTYNITGAARPGLDSVLKAIGEELKGLVVEKIDALLLQEQDPSGTLPDTQDVLDLLNAMYPGQGITYARSALIGAGDDTQTLIYKTNTVQLLEQVAVGTVTFTGPARQTLRFKLKPVGYDDSAAFYIYNSHYKASQGTDSPTIANPNPTPNAQRRLAEANAIRADSDALNNGADGAHVIYVGDFNFYDFDAQEPAWAR